VRLLVGHLKVEVVLLVRHQSAGPIARLQNVVGVVEAARLMPPDTEQPHHIAGLIVPGQAAMTAEVEVGCPRRRCRQVRPLLTTRVLPSAFHERPHGAVGFYIVSRRSRRVVVDRETEVSDGAPGESKLHALTVTPVLARLGLRLVSQRLHSRGPTASSICGLLVDPGRDVIQIADRERLLGELELREEAWALPERGPGSLEQLGRVAPEQTRCRVHLVVNCRWNSDWVRRHRGTSPHRYDVTVILPIGRDSSTLSVLGWHAKASEAAGRKSSSASTRGGRDAQQLGALAGIEQGSPRSPVSAASAEAAARR